MSSARIDSASIELYIEFEGRWTVKIDPALPGVEPLLRQILALNTAENMRLARNSTNEGIL